jgi:uncharacterized membrane protein
MTSFLIAGAAAGLPFLVIDLVWLGVMTPRLYRPAIGHLMAGTINLPAAVAFYVVYIAAMAALAVAPAVEAGAPTRALFAGAALGLAAYGAYNLSNLATLQGWPARLALIDMVWGASATAGACWLGAALMRLAGWR